MAKRHFHAHETARVEELDGLPLAGFGQRALGFLIDLFLVILLWAPLELAWALLVSHEWNGRSNFHITFTFHEWRSLLVALLYYVLVNYFTNGKSVASGSRVRGCFRSRMNVWGFGSVWSESWARVSAAEGIGFLQYFFSSNRMCVHDRIAETIVGCQRSSKNVFF